jgi:hypothetical protein
MLSGVTFLADSWIGKLQINTLKQFVNQLSWLPGQVGMEPAQTGIGIESRRGDCNGD